MLLVAPRNGGVTALGSCSPVGILKVAGIVSLSGVSPGALPPPGLMAALWSLVPFGEDILS